MISKYVKGRLTASILSLFLSTTSAGQSNVMAIPENITQLPNIFTNLISKIDKTEIKVRNEITRYLKKCERQDKRIYKALLNKDSTLAKNYLHRSIEKLTAIKGKITVLEENPVYIPVLDTIKGLLAAEATGIVNDSMGKVALQSNWQSIKNLENTLAKSTELQQFMNQRKDMLQNITSGIGLSRELLKANKQLYYYSQQIREYKEVLTNPKLPVAKVIQLAKQSKFFREFMEKNSMLASLFGTQGSQDNIDPAALPGLQTRSQLNALIQTQMARGGPNAQPVFQQNLQQAKSQLTEMKNQIISKGGGSSDDILPQGFKPNNQKTKTFLQRLEYGTNIQSQKATNYFPVTSDIGLSIGYKLNDKSILGIGASFKLGWGRSWNDLKITGQGLSLRSFVDWKIKRNFYLSGGYEQNYRNAITVVSQLQNLSAWQQSGLIGISKKITLKNKLLKGSKVQLLYDFLSQQHKPASQAIIFRIGYTMK